MFEEVWLEGRLEPHLMSVYGRPTALLPAEHDCADLTYTKLAVARAAGRVNRASGRGGGSAAPGRLLLRMAPRAIRSLAARLAEGSTLISATNGKTTTARMLATILETEGRTVVHNRSGANTHWGVCTALAESSGETGVFEVDEAWLPLLASELRPRQVVLGNLFRDRLDAYGELDQLTELWRGLLRGPNAPAAVIANADDPLLSGPGGVLDEAPGEPVLFGISVADAGREQPEHPNEGHSCLRCGTRLCYTRAYVGQLGHYRCVGCDLSRPQPQVRATKVRELGLAGVEATIALPGTELSVRIPMPGLHNVYNALAAAAAAWQLGARPESIRQGLESMKPPFGRGETFLVEGRSVSLLLVKNPVGMNETLRLLRIESHTRPLHLWFALNDLEPDGQDVSWIWDADFERLAGVATVITCSGRRAAELALRLKYAGLDCPLHVDRDLESFATALAAAPDGLVALPTYSALLELRAVLNSRGVSLTDWGLSARAAA